MTFFYYFPLHMYIVINLNFYTISFLYASAIVSILSDGEPRCPTCTRRQFNSNVTRGLAIGINLNKKYYFG